MATAASSGVDDACRPGFRDRLAAILVVVAAGLVTWVLAGVTPDPRGHGTHVGIGLTPCAFAEIHRAPCPTCGVTTAACHVVHLQPLRALYVQPFGALLAVAGLGLAVRALWCLVRGRAFLPGLARLPYGTITTVALVTFVLAWGWKALTFVP